jgi:hypothetical protein
MPETPYAIARDVSAETPGRIFPGWNVKAMVSASFWHADGTAIFMHAGFMDHRSVVKLALTAALHVRSRL